MGHAGSGVELRVDDVMGADAPQDAAVGARRGLRPDLRHPQVHEVGGGEHGGLQRRPDSDDGDAEVAGAGLFQGVDVRGVGLDDAEPVRPLLRQVGVPLDRQDVPPEPVQRRGDGGSEAPEPHHEDAAIVDLLSCHGSSL